MSENNSIASGFMWRLMERFLNLFISFAVSVVLARLLGPEAYGTVALVLVSIEILNVFTDSGFGTALIQKKDADELDFSSVFVFNISICLVLYLIVWFTAPLIERFYGIEGFKSYLRVLGLVIPVDGVKNIQAAYISRNLAFRHFFKATISGTIVSGAIGVFMAFRGFGVWALVAQNLINEVVDTAILCLSLRFKPSLKFSFTRIRSLFSYGWKILFSTLINVFYGNVRHLIIGKVYTTEDLSYYAKGDSIPNRFVNAVNIAAGSVLLPSMSQEQDNPEAVKEIASRVISVGSYVLMPLMAGLAVCAKPVITLLLSDEWIMCVPYMQIFCLMYAFSFVHSANQTAIKSMGRSDITLKLEIFNKVTGIALLVFAVPKGVFAIAITLVASDFIAMVAEIIPNRKLIGYSPAQQLCDILPSMVFSVIMGCAVYSVSLLGLAPAISLPVQVLAGIVVYLLLSVVFRVKAFETLKEVIIKVIKK